MNIIGAIFLVKRREVEDNVGDEELELTPIGIFILCIFRKLLRMERLDIFLKMYSINIGMNRLWPRLW